MTIKLPVDVSTLDDETIEVWNNDGTGKVQPESEVNKELAVSCCGGGVMDAKEYIDMVTKEADFTGAYKPDHYNDEVRYLQGTIKYVTAHEAKIAVQMAIDACEATKK